jgi:hypothetical protein
MKTQEERYKCMPEEKKEDEDCVAKQEDSASFGHLMGCRLCWWRSMDKLLVILESSLVKQVVSCVV